MPRSSRSGSRCCGAATGAFPSCPRALDTSGVGARHASVTWEERIGRRAALLGSSQVSRRLGQTRDYAPRRLAPIPTPAPLPPLCTRASEPAACTRSPPPPSLLPMAPRSAVVLAAAALSAAMFAGADAQAVVAVRARSRARQTARRASALLQASCEAAAWPGQRLCCDTLLGASAADAPRCAVFLPPQVQSTNRKARAPCVWRSCGLRCTALHRLPCSAASHPLRS